MALTYAPKMASQIPIFEGAFSKIEVATKPKPDGIFQKFLVVFSNL